jgi:hypothetical protein
MEQQKQPAAVQKSQKQPKEKKNVEKKDKIDIAKLPKPDFTLHRLSLWESLKKKQDEEFKGDLLRSVTQC